MAKTDTAVVSTTEQPSSGDTLGRAVKVAGETIAPGASLILDGDLKLGILHVIGGRLVRGLMGPIAVGYLALNSYSKSTSGKHLHERLFAGRS